VTPEELAAIRKAAVIRQRKRRAADPWACRESSRKYYYKNTERCKARLRAWRERNPEKVAAYNAANRARHAEAQRRLRARKKWLAWTKRLAQSRMTVAA
jgi:hypothetical protein